MRIVDVDKIKAALEEDGHLSAYIEEVLDQTPTAGLIEYAILLRAAFITRLTVDSQTRDRRRAGYNQAIFDAVEGFACFNGTDLDMVLNKFDAAVEDLRRIAK